MNPQGWHAAEWSAFGQVGALVVATIAGVFVGVQVLQTKALRGDQTRPYVIVDFEFRDFLVYLTIRNIGTTPACDVTFAFDTPLAAPGSRDNDFAIFREPIPMIAPGRRIRVRMGQGPDFFNETKNDGIPLRYEVAASYTRLGKRRRMTDPPTVLDLRPYQHTIVEQDELHQISRHLKSIKDTMHRWTDSGMLRVQITPSTDPRPAWEVDSD